MQDYKNYMKKVVITLVVIIAFFTVPLLLYYALPIFTPFIFAFIFAVLIEPVNQMLIKGLRVRRTTAASISYFMMLGSFFLLAYLLFARIIRETFDLVRNTQKKIPEIQAWFSETFQYMSNLNHMLPNEVRAPIDQGFSTFMNQLSSLNLLSNLGTLTLNFTTAIPNFFIGLVLFFISLYMISLDLIAIKMRFYSYFKESSRHKLELVLTDLRAATLGFLQAQVIISSITYVVSLVGLLLLDVNYALAIALLIIVVDLLPILGTGAILWPWSAYALTQGQINLGVGLIVLYLVILIMRRIIEPKILGGKIGLSALATLISIWAGFKLIGVTGVFIGPLFLIFFKALQKANIINFRFKI